MSIFGDLDIASAADDPFSVDPGTYHATVSEVKVKGSKDQTKKGLQITYTILTCDENPAMAGRTVSEWKTIPEPDDPKNPTADDAKAMSFLKMRLLSLGIPENRMNTVEFVDLQGVEVVITVEKNNGYTNVKRVELYDDSDFKDDLADNPFA